MSRCSHVGQRDIRKSLLDASWVTQASRCHVSSTAVDISPLPAWRWDWNTEEGKTTESHQATEWTPLDRQPCTYGWFTCCMTETNTTFWSHYPPIKNKLKKKRWQWPQSLQTILARDMSVKGSRCAEQEGGCATEVLFCFKERRNNRMFACWWERSTERAGHRSPIFWQEPSTSPSGLWLHIPAPLLDLTTRCSCAGVLRPQVLLFSLLARLLQISTASNASAPWHLCLPSNFSSEMQMPRFLLSVPRLPR